MNIEIQQLCCVGISLLSILSICILNLSSKILCDVISFKRLLYIEESLLSLIASFWIFYMFDLKIALLFWVIAYVTINVILRKNAIIKCAYSTDESFLKKGISVHNNLWETKKCVVVAYRNKHKLNLNKIYLKHHTSFFLGLLVWSLLDVFNFHYTSISSSALSTYDILSKNILLLTVALYYGYKIAYKICVDNINGMWFDNKKFFNIYFLLHCVLFYIVVIAISLG